MKAILLVLFDSGLRASELCGLKIDDVYWDAQTIVVRETKGSNQRVISIGTAATRALMAYLRSRALPSPWVFAKLDGQKLTPNALKLSLKRAFYAAEIDFKGIHAFRRASGIEYLKRGGQAEDLRVLMGWRSQDMIRRYVKAAEVERATSAHKRFSPAAISDSSPYSDNGDWKITDGSSPAKSNSALSPPASFRKCP